MSQSFLRMPAMLVDVAKFEFARSLTIGRIALWVMLALFPPVILGLLRLQIELETIEPWGAAAYFLIPEVICLLGLLLWATPVVSTELEGQTWLYLAMRPSGRWIVLLGKYLTAVVWTFAATLLSVTLCSMLLIGDGVWTFWWTLVTLSFLSCVTHGAIYTLIGTVFYRKTMVVAVVYTLVFEYGLSFVPAIINQLTINYRLRGLLADWSQWRSVRSLAEATLGIETATTHLIALAIVVVLCLAAAVWRVRVTEYPTQQDGGA